MVLKKSNSRLNSGATQRVVTHEGIHKLYDCYSCWPPYKFHVESYLLLTTDIQMSSQEAKTSLHACLEEMYNYLGFDMPDLSHLINRKFKFHDMLANSANHIKEYSLNKHKMWLLPERITQMKSDIDFLRCLTQNLEVRFHDVQDSMITTSSINRNKSLRVNTITSSEIIAKSSDCVKQPPESTTSRRRQTSHGRGVQRSYLLSRKQNKCYKKQQSEEEGQEEKLGHIDVYLYAPYSIHARSVYCKMAKRFARGIRLNTSRLKSSTKMNGRNKGRFPCRQGYCKRDIEMDTLDAINEVYEDNTDLSIFKDNEELNTNHTPISRGASYDITDFITVRRRRLTGEKRNKRKRATREDEDVEGCGPLFNRIRHPKGSFVIVSKDEHHLDNVELKEMSMSLPRQNNSKFAQNDSWFARKTALGLDVPTTANITKAFQLEDIHDFDSGFVLVNLAFSEELEKWFSFSREQKSNEVLIDNKFSVKVGDSRPECFVVDCNPNKMHTSGQHWRVLIGRRREPGSDLFLVSIQDQGQTPSQTQQHLQKLTTNYKNASFSIDELIKILTSIDSREVTTQPRQTSEPVKEKWLSSNFVWRNMPLNIFNITESCTVEETANILEEECAIDRNVPKRQTIFVESHDDSLVTQCDVCLVAYDYSGMSTSPIVLLPCSHTYCVCCWRAHLQHCIRNGANSIACMSTNCTNVMDIATISTILPYSLVQNWQAQVRNRNIDCSPFCRWCPSLACDKVAVSRNETLKEQFGKVITCACQQCWCSGCQGDPHWPASCDQMAAYRKLLTKTDRKLMFPESDAVQVNAKRCPGCRYTIERDGGCVLMHCSMCGHDFCWNCLEKPHTHGGVCKQKSVQTTTHLLINKLNIIISFNWYHHCLMLKRRMASMLKINQWLRHLRMTSTSRLILSLSAYTNNQAATVASLRAEECVLFLKQANTLQESMHVLIGFAELGECYKSKSLTKRALSKMFRLEFITSRLGETILEKSLLHLCKTEKITTHLLQAGRNVMRELSVLAPALQQLSKDVETTSVGELDTADIIYYK